MYSASARQNVRYFRNQLDSLQFRNVVWQPYDIDNLPAYCCRTPQLWTFQGYVIYRTVVDVVYASELPNLNAMPEETLRFKYAFWAFAAAIHGLC
ncbi:unnamed protein product [Cuscuta campestris]|uniref:Aminotransferase-like plant mobile domain-containing protein n=1 Tax=Cuscuta campestris TaxID=132261 RepID=A0A484KEK9_9ASTE|nr:unnamed protein product [Cuscuta campestris]